MLLPVEALEVNPQRIEPLLKGPGGADPIQLKNLWRGRMVPGDLAYDLIERQGIADPITRTYIPRFEADANERKFSQITSNWDHWTSRITIG